MQGKGVDECIGVHMRVCAHALHRAHLCVQAHAAPNVCRNQWSMEGLTRAAIPGI